MLVDDDALTGRYLFRKQGGGAANVHEPRYQGSFRPGPESQAAFICCERCLLEMHVIEWLLENLSLLTHV